MDFPKRFSNLPEYAFPRLRALLAPHPAGGEVLPMSIGDPQHAFPSFVPEVIARHAGEFRQYPPNEGTPGLRHAISEWLARRYSVAVDPDREVLVLNGTREGLFNAAIALCPETRAGKPPMIAIPNPFYQCYAVAAAAVGAEPVFVAAPAENGFLPDFAALPRAVLDRLAMVYICSPSNPQGAVAGRNYWRALLALAEKHDFRVLADECYAEIYRDAAPVGALQVARETDADPERVLIFHSLSKRSNLAGLRSGFVAGGPKSIAALKLLRNYGGAPLPLPLQHVSEAVWRDEAHVVENRRLYAEKFTLADEILGNLPGYSSPEAGFFLWLAVGDGEAATVDLWRRAGVQVLPGAYLGRDAGDGQGNPGAGYIRVALVAGLDDVRTGLKAIRDSLGPLS